MTSITRLNELFLEDRTAIQNNDIGSIGFSLGLAALMLGQALQIGNGVLTLSAIFWLTTSLICLGCGLVMQPKPVQAVFGKLSIVILLLGVCWQIYQLENTLPGIYLLPSFMSSLWLFRLAIAIAGFFALLSLAPTIWLSKRWQNTLMLLTLLAMWFSGVWVIKASPNPHIDTFVFQQASGNALLHGENPYVFSAPNIYRDKPFYGPELVNKDKLTIGNPYPPLSVYFSTLGYLAGGDIRYSHLLAIVLAAALIAFLHPGREAKLAAYIFLFTPRVFFVLEQSWTEPIIVFFIAATLFCAVRFGRGLPVMLGLVFASKQYFLFLLPLTLLLIPPKSSWRNWFRVYGPMGSVMVAVTAPLAFWNMSAFLWNVGAAQWYQVFRFDALSYLALYAHIFNQAPSPLISFIALGIAYLFVWRFAPRTLTGFVISTAWCLVIFFAFNKQAFCNYYFLVIGTICCALASFTAQSMEMAENKSPSDRVNALKDELSVSRNLD